MSGYKRGAARANPGGVAHPAAIAGPSQTQRQSPAATARLVSHDPRHGLDPVHALALLRHKHLGPLIHTSPLILLSPVFWALAAELLPEFEPFREVDWFDCYYTVCSRLDV